MKKLAIITTHPIQYYAPVFRLLHQRGIIGIKVFYSWGEASLSKHDPGFGQDITWDIPLLEGYPYEWADNTSPMPGSHHFNGIITPGLNRQIELFKPDALLVFGWSFQGHLKTMRHFKNRIPVYFRGDSTLLDPTGTIKQLLRYVFLRWVYRFIDYAFYTGTRNKTYFLKFGLKENQLGFAPHAVDNDRFGAGRQVEAAALRTQLGLSEQAVLILFAGKFESKKSPESLLRTFLCLAQPHLHLLFVGSGSLKITLQIQAAGHPRVHFMDFQNQSFMPVIYQACNVFCLPSQGPGETWGLAVNEAMASGKAILISNKVGCAIDLVKDGANGVVFEAKNENDLLEKLREITASRTVLEKFGVNSLKIIKDWNFTQIARAIEQKLTHEKSRPHKT